MKLTRIHVKNFRALKDCPLDLGDFVCIVGANNAGKSTLLQAIHRFIDGKKIDPADLHDSRAPIDIHVTLTSFTDDDWQRIPDEEARARTRAILRDGSIELVRRVTPESSVFLYMAQEPRDVNCRWGTIEARIRGKKGKDLVDAVKVIAPAVAALATGATKAAFETACDAYKASLPPEQLEPALVPIATGIPESIVGLLPEPIYIPAIKDVKDELKVKDAATFGKILGLMSGLLGRALGQDAEMFERIKLRFGPAKLPDGAPNTDRLPQIGQLEQCVDRYLQEQFDGATVSIIVPAPEIKTLLSGASIVVNDGVVKGPVETMGDGMKRSVMFSILRAYADLSRSPEWGNARGGSGRYLFLFEEPELYLHPAMQRILFDALGTVSLNHQVVVTTHSPLFFGPKSTTTFVKLAKRKNGDSKPHSTPTAINLATDETMRKTFDLINFENNNAAFFAERVVLCEGPSDAIVLRHVAPKFSNAWNFDRSGAMLVRVGGKGSFRRYRDFFAKFDVRVSIVGDVDVLLDGLSQLDLGDTQLATMLSDIIQAIDAELDDDLSPSKKTAESKLSSNRFVTAWRLFRRHLQGHVEGTLDVKAAGDLIEVMDAIEKDSPRRVGLRRDDLRPRLQAILARLRDEHRVCLWHKGAIEANYPEDLRDGGDKVHRAEVFVERNLDVAELRRLSDLGDGRSEFEVVLKSILGAAPVLEPASAVQTQPDTAVEAVAAGDGAM